MLLDWPNHFVRIVSFIKKIKNLFHCFIILLHVVAWEFLVQRCCICFCQNFTDAKNFMLCKFPFRHISILVRLTNDTTCNLLGPLNALLQFYIRCNSTEKTCRCFYYKLSFHELFKYAEMFLGKLSRHFKIKRAVPLIIYASGLTKNWYHVLYSL